MEIPKMNLFTENNLWLAYFFEIEKNLYECIEIFYDSYDYVLLLTFTGNLI